MNRGKRTPDMSSTAKGRYNGVIVLIEERALLFLLLRQILHVDLCPGEGRAAVLT